MNDGLFEVFAPSAVEPSAHIYVAEMMQSQISELAWLEFVESFEELDGCRVATPGLARHIELQVQIDARDDVEVRRFVNDLMEHTRIRLTSSVGESELIGAPLDVADTLMMLDQRWSESAPFVEVHFYDFVVAGWVLDRFSHASWCETELAIGSALEELDKSLEVEVCGGQISVCGPAVDEAEMRFVIENSIHAAAGDTGGGADQLRT